MIFSPMRRTADEELSTAESPNVANFWMVKGGHPTRPGVSDKSSTTNLMSSAFSSELLGLCLLLSGKGSIKASCKTLVLTTFHFNYFSTLFSYLSGATMQSCELILEYFFLSPPHYKIDSICSYIDLFHIL